ncbi:MAG: hypothetical protein ICV53_15680 [Flavisolibacter sp.]|nr:hypothetical protein [Flavisolibacter sp.]
MLLVLNTGLFSFVGLAWGAYQLQMPDQIGKIEMERRGQMGLYWNSLNALK